MLDLANKNPKAIVISMHKKLKETMFNVLKT